MATLSLEFTVPDNLLAKIHAAVGDQDAITLYAEDPTHFELFVGEYDADTDEPLCIVQITVPQLVGAR